MSKFKVALADTHSNAEFYTDFYFQINSCGLLTTISKSVSHRPPRKDFMLIYVSEGNGIAEINNKQISLIPGDFILIKPGDPLNFTFEGNSTHFWIHFTGSAVNDILGECNFNDTNVYRTTFSTNIWNIFTDIYMCQVINQNHSKIRAKSYFLKMISEISLVNSNNSNTNNNNNVREKPIYPALKYMSINYQENHNLQFYADLCQLSLSTFKQYFSKITGSSPLNYLTNIRLNIAKNLLSSDSNISNISSSVGYNDPLYFSRIFKKRFGVSPKQFIKELK